MWDVEYGYIESWLDDQDEETVADVFAALEVLQREGPILGRPLVDTLQGSKVKNLKELRPASPKGSEIRILFAFDPLRHAVMLLAGDKASGRGDERWAGWYKAAIPTAEALYKRHLEGLARSHG